MPQIEAKRLPVSVFSMSDDALEGRLASLPNSMIPVVDDALKRLAESIGIRLIVGEKEPEQTVAAASIKARTA
jgi:hypothetical protein